MSLRTFFALLSLSIWSASSLTAQMHPLFRSSKVGVSTSQTNSTRNEHTLFKRIHTKPTPDTELIRAKHASARKILAAVRSVQRHRHYSFQTMMQAVDRVERAHNRHTGHRDHHDPSVQLAEAKAIGDIAQSVAAVEVAKAIAASDIAHSVAAVELSKRIAPEKSPIIQAKALGTIAEAVGTVERTKADAAAKIVQAVADVELAKTKRKRLAHPHAALKTAKAVAAVRVARAVAAVDTARSVTVVELAKALNAIEPPKPISSQELRRISHEVAKRTHITVPTPVRPTKVLTK